MVIFEVIGYPTTCPDEAFVVGVCRSNERAERAAEAAYIEYTDCEFKIETKYVEDDEYV
jgi:hypothetical protein